MKQSPEAPDPDRQLQSSLGFLDHLEELRKRLIRVFIILAVGTLACLAFARRIIDFLTLTFVESENSHLALLHPTEGFMVYLKTALVAGIFLTVPLWLYQIWAFIAPGLYTSEKRVILPAVFVSSLVFLIGAGFGWYILPYAVQYFQAFALGDTLVNWSLGKFIDFSLRILLAFGVVFELPLVIYLAARLGLVTPRTLRKHRKYAIVGILILAGIITPPDIFTQVVLAIPLIILYEVGIIAAAFGRKKVRETPA